MGRPGPGSRNSQAPTLAQHIKAQTNEAAKFFPADVRYRRAQTSADLRSRNKRSELPKCRFGFLRFLQWGRWPGWPGSPWSPTEPAYSTEDP